MKKLTIKNSIDEQFIIFEKYKVIFTQKIENVNNIINIFNANLLKNHSEYYDNNDSYKLYIDDKQINSNINYYFLDGSFDIDNELKNTSKSLTYKYLTKLLDNKETYEILDNINLKITNILDDCQINDNLQLKIDINEFTIDDLKNLFEVKLIKDNYTINSFDLTLEEKIIYKLSILKNVLQDCDAQTIILINGLITNDIIDCINIFNDNVIFIILTMSNHLINNISNYAIYNNQILDLNYKLKIKYINDHLSFYSEKDEYLKYVKDYIIGNYYKKNIEFVLLI